VGGLSEREERLGGRGW